MRSFASALAIVAAMAALAPPLAAQPQSERLYDEALERDASLRRDMDRLEAGASAADLLERVRVLVTTFKDLSRLFPDGANADDALWQGATLSAAAFWQFGQAPDRETALELFEELTTRFPSSAAAKKIPPERTRLAAAGSRPAPAPRTAAAPTPARPDTPAKSGGATPATAPPPTAAPPATDRPPSPPGSAAAAAPAPPASTASRSRASAPPAKPSSRTSSTASPATPSAPATLRAIRREALADVLRITLELDREVAFSDEQLAAPPRVFIDMRHATAVRSLSGATLPFPEGVVRQLRVGLHVGSRTRVVLDLAERTRYSVYALYNPFRIVIDFERERPAAANDGGPVSRGFGVPRLVSPAAPATAAPQPVPEAPAGISEAPPAAAAANGRGGFSLSRQLGLRVSRIVIDPGHGGQDPGARGRGLNEAAIVLDVALRLEKLLLDRAGIGVVLTRRTNGYVALEERTAIANRAGADLFLSIHANASSNTAARGIETYFLDFANTPAAEAIAARENAASTQTMGRLPDIVRAIAMNNKIDESRDFAAIVQTSLYENLRKTNRSLRNLGVKQAPFVVLIGATMPSVLAEISFLTNKQDADLLKTDKYRQQIAQALFAGIMRYQESLKKVTAIAAR